MSRSVPLGLRELLTGFALEVLRQRPTDLLGFAVQHFTALQEQRSSGPGATCSSARAPVTRGEAFDQGSTPTESSPDEDEQEERKKKPEEDRDEEEEEEDEFPDDFTFKAPVLSKSSRRVSVCAEPYNPEEEEQEAMERGAVHHKSDAQRQRLVDACRHILLFKSLEQDQLSEVLDSMFEVLVRPNECIINQGDDGDNFYVIERGVFEILIERSGGPLLVGCYDNRGSFGELALMYNTPRAATIKATQEGALWALDRGTFRRLIVKNNARKRRMYESFIESVPLLAPLQASERMKLVDVLGMRSFSDGQQIIRQGDSADCFYIVESGEVKVTVRSQVGAEVCVCRCSRGQYFGELALVTNKPRAASVFAVGETRCLVIDVQAFERLLGSCKQILQRNISHYQQQLQDALAAQHTD